MRKSIMFMLACCLALGAIALGFGIGFAWRPRPSAGQATVLSPPEKSSHGNP